MAARCRTPGRKRRPRGYLVGLAAGVGTVLAMAGVFLLLWFWSRPTRFPGIEDKGEQLKAIRGPFRNPKPRAEANLEKRLKTLFDHLGAALRGRDAEEILSQFDVDRMCEELDAQKVVPPRWLQRRRDLIVGVRRGINRSLTKDAALMEFSSFEIRAVKKLPNNEAVVIVHHRDDQGLTSKMRWWVRGKSGTWLIYDFENLATGVRCSTLMGALFAAGIENNP
jgi:hypothetical protein